MGIVPKVQNLIKGEPMAKKQKAPGMELIILKRGHCNGKYEEGST